MTLFSVANRFLKLEFPPQRNYELCLQLVNKGLLNPQFSKTMLQTLPLKTVELLAQLVFQTSAEPFVTEGASDPAAVDFVLSLMMAIEEAEQYDLLALVSEDLAVMEAHQQGGLHGFYFKPNRNTEHLAHVLQAQGYRNDFMAFAPDVLEPYLAYWLCRRLTVIFPWTALLQGYSDEHAVVFPYLYRLGKVQAFMSQELDTTLDITQPEVIIQQLVPQIDVWIREEFPRFSQEARIPTPIQELVLAEGSTEELLIPAISKALGYNLDYEGIMIQSVGGKNQMLQQYVQYAEQLTVPICIVLDKDAQSLLPDLSYYQRPQDNIFILEEGEFEDIYALELIVKTVNEYYQPNHPLTLNSLRKMEGSSRVKVLQTLWQDLGLGIFDKVEFAQHLVQTINHKKLLSPPMKRLVERIIEAKQNVAHSPVSR
jgi:hypothetical protein